MLIVKIGGIHILLYTFSELGILTNTIMVPIYTSMVIFLKYKLQCITNTVE